jgi:hypothetical protein
MTAVDPLSQLLESLHRRGAITAQHRESIKAATNVPAVIANLLKSGEVSEPVGRTILRSAKAKAHKSATYNDILDKHSRRAPDGGK